MYLEYKKEYQYIEQSGNRINTPDHSCAFWAFHSFLLEDYKNAGK